MKKPNIISRLSAYSGNFKILYILVVVFCLVSVFFNVQVPKILGDVTTILFDGVASSSFDTQLLITTLIILAAFYVFAQLFAYLVNMLCAKIATKLIANMRVDINNKLHKTKLDYFDTHNDGEVLSTVTNDIEFITQFLTVDLPQTILQVFQLVGIVFFIFSINIWLAIISLLSVPITLVFAKIRIQVSSKDFKKQQDYFGALNGIVEDYYKGHEVLTTYSYNQRAHNEFKAINDKLQKVNKKGLTGSNMLIPISMGISNIAYVVIAIVGCMFAVQGSMTIGGVQAMLQYTKNLSSPFKTVATVAASFSTAMASAKRVFEFLDSENESPEPEKSELPQAADGSVDFKDVKFGYVPGKLLMDGVNIQVKPGQKVAVVGPTGAGKTTLINLLMRFYELNGGSIDVDGVNTTKMTRSELRERIGMVLQETWLFEGTIMDNLKYAGKDVSDEDVIKAAKTTNAHRFIKTLPNGYNYKLTTGGENISQGERQMLTIVRAMCTDPEIMILDEATSNVDTHTEVEIQRAMRQLMQGKTSFVIAHRISTIKDSDLILYMEKGDIKEAGTHDGLMQKNGKYASLYNSQFE